MAAEEGVHEARQVSEAFIQQYYHLVGTRTNEVHKVYHVDASLVTRPGPDGTMTSFSSLEAIKKHYLSSYYDGTTFDVLSVDTQSSLGGGVFIMVIGFLTGKDNLKRKFSQGFYLARQDNVYVVVNDMYRFVDEDKSSTTRALPADVSVAKPLEEIKRTKKKSLDAAEVKKVVAGATPPVTAQKHNEPVAETAPLDGAKKSFASMVLSMSRNAASLQVKAAPVQKPSSMAQPKPHVAPAPEKTVHQKMVDEPGTSIFVSNLPMDAMAPQVYELFKGFGTIKPHGVQIRSTRASGCFGFIAFESAASVQSVLKAAKSNQFKLGEHKLRVKEKQIVYDGSKSQSGSVDGSKSQSGSVRGSKTEKGSADGGKSQSGTADGVKSQSGSADGSKTEKGSADGGKTEVGGLEDDDFKLVISRRSRKEKRRQG